MLCIISYDGNAHQNDQVNILHPLKQLKFKRRTITNIGEDVQQLELSYIAGIKMK